MTVLQVVLNIVIAIVLATVVGVAMSKAPAFDFKDLVTFLLQLVVVGMTFVYNFAAKLGVRG